MKESDRDRVLRRVQEVFADPEKASDWLQRPNRMLNNVPPTTLLDIASGCQIVEAVLGRIEYGVLS